MPEPTTANHIPEEAHGRLVSGVVLPEEPSTEELARDWTLSEANIGAVLLRVAATMLQVFTLTYYT